MEFGSSVAICIKLDEFLLKMRDIVFKMMSFVFKMMILIQTYRAYNEQRALVYN